jgi:DNA-binding phage protein
MPQLRIVEEKDIVALLRAEVQKAGTVAAWSRNASLDRTYVSGVVYQRRRPTAPKLLCALGLRRAVVGDGARVLNAQDVQRMLEAEVAAVGGQSAWARKNRMSRTYLNRVLRKAQPPSANIIRALGLRPSIISD